MSSSHIVSVLLIGSLSTGLATRLTAADKEDFMKAGWLNPNQAWEVYEDQYERIKMLGSDNKRNPNRLFFYPGNRVRNGVGSGKNDIAVIAVCLLFPNSVMGYRTNSITLSILQMGFTHRRTLLAPKQELKSQADQLNCWNYEQESVCQPLRDCRGTAPFSVGLITREGWGIFQLKVDKKIQSHYQCTSETQSILAAGERTESKAKEYVMLGSDIMQLLVFDTDIGEPHISIEPSYLRGSPLTAQCRVPNSKPGSEYNIDLVLKRPPPAGVPGSFQDEFLARRRITASEAIGLLDWRGEVALLSHHGLTILCRVSDDWGSRKAKRVASGQLMVRHMFPAHVRNPRIRLQIEKSTSNMASSYKTPYRIMLRSAEYAVCKSDGYPPPRVKWTVNEDKAVWILNDTMFITRYARINRPFIATCLAASQELKLKDQVSVEVVVMSANSQLPSSGLSRVATSLLHAFVLWCLLQAF